MKKLIFIIGFSLILTGCSPYIGLSRPTTELVDTNKTNRIKETGMYVNKHMKEIIGEINSLTERYGEESNSTEFNHLYIHPYDGEGRGFENAVFDNNFIAGKEHFYEVVDILDKSISPGLMDYIKEMRTKNLINNEKEPVTIKKMGQTTVYVQNRGDEENYISIKINFLDIADDYYNEVFSKISNDKYILDDVKIGGELDLIEFVNAEIFHYFRDTDNVQIRYNVYFKDHNLNKVNILLRGKNDMELEDEDIEVFMNLLDTLDLHGEEKDLLIDAYENLFKGDNNSQKVLLSNYELGINYKKGNTYSNKLQEYRYFSITPVSRGRG